ncbi:MAG: class I SAM-dependent methyltransferase [bacterium]
MADASLLALLELIPQSTQKTLIVLDESADTDDLGLIAQLAKTAPVAAVSNRWEAAEKLTDLGVDCQFNDFAFDAFAPSTIDFLAFRVTKEKSVAHHVINRAGELLAEGGQLLLAGQKQEGIKALIKNAAALLGDNVSPRKNGAIYTASLTKNILSTESCLEDDDYATVREIGSAYGQPIFSKPGLFGWKKIDTGTRMLADFAIDYATGHLPPGPTILDLGCGYGLLSLATHQLGDCRIVATDNNAAAVDTCRENFTRWGINGEVNADNCAANISEKFDLVVSHPPFHRGFGTDYTLTERFIESAAKRLKRDASALFVANSFVPLERLSSDYFRSVETVENSGKFKIVALRQPKK